MSPLSCVLSPFRALVPPQFYALAPFLFPLSFFFCFCFSLSLDSWKVQVLSLKDPLSLPLSFAGRRWDNRCWFGGWNLAFRHADDMNVWRQTLCDQELA